jgi:endonuclease YncB( thermonuclease family)
MDYVPAAEVRVIDGDTIRHDAERIRILGIDAPETVNRLDVTLSAALLRSRP